MALPFSDTFNHIKQAFSSESKDSILGVDIGSSAIKVVELHNKKNVPTLNTYGELQLGPYADIEIGRTTNLQVATLAQALIDIVRESSVATKKVALGISYNSSFATVVNIPTASQQEVSEKVPVEARKYIPVPLNTVSLDWFTIGQSADGTTSKVLIAAIHNDSLKKYQSTVTGAGLRARLTEIEVFSVIRSAVSQRDSVVAVLDLGASGTRLYIAEKGTLLKTHSLRLGGTELTQILADTLQVEFSKAEGLKRGGLEESAEGKKAVQSALARALREVGQVVHRFEEEEEKKVDKVILSGGGSLLKNIDTLTQDILERPVERSDSFAKVAYPAFLEDVLTEAGPSFSVAIGAALQQLSVQK